ncbi:MAG: T9SS type A sorting domain-containing protein [Chitinophagaceae bacterium]
MKQSLLLFLVFVTIGSYSQPINQCPDCWQPVYRQRMVWNENISPSINGYVEFLPNGYNPNDSKKYPLIISFHGRDKQGPGNSQQSVCIAACEGLSIKIEQNRFPETVVNNGTTYSFIILTPQYLGGTGADFAPFITYAINKYKVDASRIYLTGLSLGSNFLMDYMSSSPQNAKRIAGIVPLATCVSYNSAGSNNIGSNSIHYWGIHCGQDVLPSCDPSNTTGWANEINKYAPAGSPVATANLTPIYNDFFPHDIFSTVYDINWKTLPDNVFQKHITEWMIQYTSSAAGNLPATIAKYEVSLKNKRVTVDWTTSLESNTDFFTIERAGRDMQFKQIGKLPAAGNSSNPISYSFFDPAPLKGTSFYRVVLMNKDGMPDIYEIKKITNREFGISFSLSPVPSRKSVLLSFEIEESQKLNFSIRDINGRQLRVWSANFSSGAANIPINIEVLAPGIYYLAIQGTQFNESQKFIKQ